ANLVRLIMNTFMPGGRRCDGAAPPRAKCYQPTLTLKKLVLPSTPRYFQA
ncbi:MAG: hypothetical protein QOK27_2512, partial [Gemmatimonadales bacterium]|nr:hypothetical protein [Gemmatimonadales bacterium]